MKRRFLGTVLLSLFGLLAFSLSPAYAKKIDKSKYNKVGNVLVKKKTVFDFGSDTIQGDLTKPDGEYFEARKRLKHGRLLTLRKNWKRRILQSVNEL
jgi:hypothetical protein